MFHYAEIKELAAFFHFFQTHQTFCKQFCIHQFDFAVSISVNDGFEIHHIQDLCLQVDTRSDFCQVHTIFFQLEYTSFCDVHNFLFVLQSDIAVECDLFNVFQEFFLFTFLSDNYFTIFNFYFQTAGCESTAEEYFVCVLSDVDEAAATSDSRTESGNVDVTMTVTFSQTQVAQIQTAAIIEVELITLIQQSVCVVSRTESDAASGNAANSAAF